MLGRHGDLSVDSYVAGVAREAGSAAELAAAAHKEDKIPALTADTYLNHCDKDYRRVQHVGSPAPL